MDSLTVEILLYKTGSERGMRGARLVDWVHEVAARKGLVLEPDPGQRDPESTTGSDT